MALLAHIDPGDWGSALPSDVEAVARSGVSGFDAFDDDEDIRIVIEPTPTEDDPPIVLSRPNPGGRP